MAPIYWRWLGRVPFVETARLQERLRDAVVRGEGPETVLFAEHDPVITLGRSGVPAHVLVAPGELARRRVEVAIASRGGAATYHGPGQIVGYPIVRLRGGVVGHLTGLANAVRAVLADLGVEAVWRRQSPGLWVGEAKICAFGVHVRHRVAMHGFALNVNGPLDGFGLIVPCGMPDSRAISLKEILGPAARLPPLHVLAARIAVALGDTLGAVILPSIERSADIEIVDGIVRMLEA